MLDDKNMIAPCGMNCTLCLAHQRKEKRCDGCNGDNATKPTHCLKCVIKNCPTIKSNETKLCYECDKFPCKRLKQLDARYRKNYGMSMIDNLLFIQLNGMETFMEKEHEKWTCKKCGEIMDVV